LNTIFKPYYIKYIAEVIDTFIRVVGWLFYGV